MERSGATTKATQKQLSILTLAVKVSPVFVHLFMPPQSKRPLMPAKRGPGRPWKRLRTQDLVNKWYKAVEQEHNTVKVFDAYEEYDNNRRTSDFSER